MRRFGVHFLLTGFAMQQAVASDAAKLHSFGLADTNAATPGYGRVVLVFLMVAGLAWAARPVHVASAPNCRVPHPVAMRPFVTWRVTHCPAAGLAMWSKRRAGRY
jgi:hypothetical protein